VNPVRRLLRYERQRRLWLRVDVQGPDDCWPWKGGVDEAGEPVFRGRSAVVAVYEQARLPVPPGGRLRRRCSDAQCVNPEHVTLERERAAGFA
jgi:hypothetical protein